MSDTFAFILPQQRPVLVTAHAQNFLTLKSWGEGGDKWPSNASGLQLKTAAKNSKVLKEKGN